jgi:putative ribosome biogenesis GTPase RsgA
MSLALPFVGRKKELAQLQRLHAERKHALILGPAGVGKTTLVNHLTNPHALRRLELDRRIHEVFPTAAHHKKLGSP